MSPSPPKTATTTTTTKGTPKKKAPAPPAVAGGEFLTFQVNGELIQVKKGKAIYKKWSTKPSTVKRRKYREKRVTLTAVEKCTAAQNLLDECLLDDDDGTSIAKEVTEKLRYERRCWQECQNEQKSEREKLEAELEKQQKLVSKLRFKVHKLEQAQVEAQAKLRRLTADASSKNDDDDDTSSDEDEQEDEQEEENHHHQNYATAAATSIPQQYNQLRQQQQQQQQQQESSQDYYEQLQQQHAWAGLPPYQPQQQQLPNVPQQEAQPLQQQPQQQQQQPRSTTTRTRLTFDESFAKLQAYKAVHGDCLVKRTYRNPVDNYPLGVFVKNMRCAYKQYLGHGRVTRTLTANMFDRLNSIDFFWDQMAAKHRSFEQRLQDLRDFKAEHGHVIVPTEYKGRHKLGMYVQTLRAMRLGTQKSIKSTLTKEQIDALEELGFVWVLKKRKAHVAIEQAAAMEEEEEENGDDCSVAKKPEATHAHV